MKCNTCGADLIQEQKFCSMCGAKVSNRCKKCGAELNEGARFCVECRTMAEDCPEQEKKPMKQDTALVIDIYRQELVKKSMEEKDVKGISLSIVVLLALIAFLNNSLEAAIFVFIFFYVVSYGISGLVLGVLGAKGTGVLLEKYDRVKLELGSDEAVKIIEAERNPQKEGMKAFKGSAGAVGCFASVITIIAVIFMMAFF